MFILRGLATKQAISKYFLLGAPTMEKLLKTQLTLVTRLMERQRMSRLRQRETMCMFHGGKITKTHRGFLSTLRQMTTADHLAKRLF